MLNLAQARKKTLCLSGALIVALTPGVAQSQGAPTTQEPKLYVDLKALTTAIEGSRSKGGDTVAATAGSMEAAQLSTYAFRAFGKQLADKLKTGNYVIVGANDPISTDRWVAFQAQYAAICNLVSGNFECKATVLPPRLNPRVPRGNNVPRTGGSPLAAVSAVLPFFSSLFRSETEISDLGGSLNDDRLLAVEVANAMNEAAPRATTVLDARLLDFTPNNPIYQKLSALQDMRKELQSRSGTDADTKIKLKAADDFISVVLSPDVNGKLPMLEIYRSQLLVIELQKEPAVSVLRVHIEKSAGTLLKRKNLAVTLGAAAGAAVTGGLIASYSVEPKSGSLVSERGLISCQTRLASLKQVHRLDKRYNAHCR